MPRTFCHVNNTPVARPDLEHVSSIIDDNVRVLDVGCGTGTLLELISSSHVNVRAVGLELSQDGVAECVRKGFAVVQGDADRDLENYLGGDFDWVILSHLIQYVRDPAHVIRVAVQTGCFVVVSFYNVAYWRNRAAFAAFGCMPPTPPSRPSDYNSAPRSLSLLDFETLCEALQVRIVQKTVLDASGRAIHWRYLHNVLGYQAIYVLAADGANVRGAQGTLP